MLLHLLILMFTYFTSWYQNYNFYLLTEICLFMTDKALLILQWWSVINLD